MNPNFPLYIPSKGRHESRYTHKALTEMGVPHYLIIEEQEYKKYAAVIDKNQLVVLDKAYQRDYETFDDLGDTKSKGPGAARNFAWQHSIDNGFSHHWVMDDNIRSFFRLNKNIRIKVSTGSIFKAMEDFCLRYKNVAMAGPNYKMFASARQKLPPFVMNTRIYSCNFIKNDIIFRWRGRYNEDTDLSLMILKAGMCTVQFNAFLQDKIVTQAVKGGNTEAFYAAEGTMPKSQMLADMHPDVAKVVYKFGRWHHHVNYLPFKKNKLIPIDDLKIDKKIDNYGMKLVNK